MALHGAPPPVSKALLLARSTDEGETFATPAPIESDYPGGACACCALRAVLRADRSLLLGFRGAHQNVRDVYVLREAGASPRFRSIRVSADDWTFEGCPMAGPSLEAVGADEIRVAWMSRDQVYRSVSRDGGRSFGPRIAPSDGSGGRRTLPLTVSGAHGEQLFAWIESGRVRWEQIGAEETPIGSCDNGPVGADTRVTAFADPDGGFVLVY